MIYLLTGQDTQHAVWEEEKGKEHLMLQYGYVSYQLRTESYYPINQLWATAWNCLLFLLKVKITFKLNFCIFVISGQCLGHLFPDLCLQSKILKIRSHTCLWSNQANFIQITDSILSRMTVGHMSEDTKGQNAYPDIVSWNLKEGRKACSLSVSYFDWLIMSYIFLLYILVELYAYPITHRHKWYPL